MLRLLIYIMLQISFNHNILRLLIPYRLNHVIILYTLIIDFYHASII